jgi:hypothetical protein
VLSPRVTGGASPGAEKPRVATANKVQNQKNIGDNPLYCRSHKGGLYPAIIFARIAKTKH